MAQYIYRKGIKGEFFKAPVNCTERRKQYMRTWKMTKNPKDKKDAVLCQYFLTNTTDAKCMYNTANFYIRNTMTGIQKSPEERTANETEVLRCVFNGILKVNVLVDEKYDAAMDEYNKAKELYDEAVEERKRLRNSIRK
jgi:chromosome segregation ATPase